jgi:hypothetical protein
MSPLLFYVFAAASFAVGLIIVKDASPHSDADCHTWERKRRRGLWGVILLTAAGLSLVIALLAQFSSG